MNWRTLREFMTSRAHTGPGPVAESPVMCQGEYRLLHAFLRSRFSGRVVLTFSEIEDLVGFALPAQARVDVGWWNAADASAGESRHATAWTLTNRVATANLSAGTVAFERRE